MKLDKTIKSDLRKDWLSCSAPGYHTSVLRIHCHFNNRHACGRWHDGSWALAVRDGCLMGLSVVLHCCWIRQFITPLNGMVNSAILFSPCRQNHCKMFFYYINIYPLQSCQQLTFPRHPGMLGHCMERRLYGTYHKRFRCTGVRHLRVQIDLRLLIWA